VTVLRFHDKSTTVHVVGKPPGDSAMMGHGGADYFLMKSFVSAVATGDPSHLLSGPGETLGACVLRCGARLTSFDRRTQQRPTQAWRSIVSPISTTSCNANPSCHRMSCLGVCVDLQSPT
jgi:hypothetical protein